MFRSTRFPVAVAAAMSTLLVLSACGGAQSRMTAHMERGQKYYAEGNFEKARVEFRNALQIAPNDTEARFMNGRVAEKVGDLRGAAGLYQGALDQNPDHVGARASLARLYLFGGAAARAKELVEPGLAKHPEDADLLTVRGAARVQLKDPAGALEDAEHAHRVAPDDENAVALLASLYRNGGDTQRAIDLIKTTVEKKPGSVDLHQVLANLYLTAEEPQSAIAEMAKVVELKPKELAHRTRLAMLYVRTKQSAEADKVMKDAVAALPDNNDAKLAYVEFVTSQSSREKGEATLRQYIAQDPKNYELQLGLAALQQRAGDQDKAIETYKSIIARDGEAAAAVTSRNRVAAIELARGKSDEAKRLIDQVLEKNPRDNDALVMRGNIALERGDTAGAIADLRAVLRDQPGSVPILRTLARAHLANGEPALAEESIRNAMEAAPADVPVRIELAQLLLQSGRGDQAVSLMEETVKRAPTNVPAREAMVRAYMASNDLAAARSAAEDLKIAAPTQATGSYLAGQVAVAQKRFDDAAKELSHALELQPAAIDALVALTRVDMARNQFATAIKRVESAVATQPTNAALRNLQGEMLLSRKDFVPARAALTEATKLAPKWWLPYRNLAMAHAAGGDVAQAIGTYEAGVKATDMQPTLVTDLAMLYEQQGKPEEAIGRYQALYDRNPRLELAANNLAMLLVTYRKDRASFDRALTLTAPFAQSKNGALLDTRGWVMFKLGQVSEALPVLERASEQAPGSKVIRYHLAMAQLKAGARDKARTNLEAALQGATNFTGIDEARTTLASLTSGAG